MIVSDGKTLDFAPQALGEVVPSLSNGYFYARQGLSLYSLFATYGHLYRSQPNVAMLVDKVANAGARLPVKVWEKDTAAGRVEDTTSPFAQLMQRPSTALAPMNFWRWTFSTYEIYGEAFWYKQRDTTGRVVNLLPMHPSRTAVHRDENGNVEYIFTLGVASAGILRAPDTDVVPFLRYNPDNLMRGLSRMESLRSTLSSEDAIRRANESWWKRGARPSLVLQHPKLLSDPAVKRLAAQVDALQSGADNVGRPLVLEEGLTATLTQLTAEEMQYIESRKLNKEEACSAYDVPPPVVHILDHATFSNITEQMRSMYRDTMTPRLEDVQSTIDHHLTGEFFQDDSRETEFDMSDVLRGDFEARADKAVALRNAGLITGNQGLDMIGLPRSADPKMDDVYANAALVPLGSNVRPPVSTEGDLIPTPFTGGKVLVLEAKRSPQIDTNLMRKALGNAFRVKASAKDMRASLVADHAKELRAFFDRQRESIKSALPLKASGVFDPGAWDDELSTILGTLSAATSQAIGSKTAADLDGTYDTGRLSDWIASNSKESAQKINATTAASVAAALEPDPEDDEELDDEEQIDGLFDGEVAARADQISLSRVAVIGGLAALAAAEMNDAASKTWQVTSANPRPEHAAMDGETVALGELFSNGMNGPGDPAGGADEVAGCTCDLVFGKD